MGDTVSANNEWIELYNSGATTVIDGWTLSDGMNLTISLAGSIPASSYVLLERNRSSGVYHADSPFVVYTGALVNTGATLVLKNASGEVMDQVAGGENWENIGGDNTTKETAQYTASGWKTGVGTPGAVNTAVGTNNTNTPTTSGKTGSSGQKVATSTVVGRLPNSPLSLTIGSQSTAYVHQLIPFTVTPSGMTEKLYPSLQYEWNFGDMATSGLKSPYHIYQYPGTYVITVRASFGKEAQVARQEITILPVTLSLARAVSGDLLVHNDAPFDVDVSGYQVQGVGIVTFPARSIMSAKGTVLVSQNHVGSGRAILRDAIGVTVASWPAPVVAVETNPEPMREIISITPVSEAVAPPVLSTLPDYTMARQNEPLVLAPTDADTRVMPAYVLAALLSLPTNTGTPETRWWPYSMLIVLIIGGILVLVMTKKVSSGADDLSGTAVVIHNQNDETPSTPWVWR